MPGLRARAAKYSSSDDEDSQVSTDNDHDNNDDDDDDDDVSLQASVGDNDDNILPSNDDIHVTLNNQVERQDAFSYNVDIPAPLTTHSNTIPPVSCIIIPNDQDDVNSSVEAPTIERVNPAGRVPIRVRQDSIQHVDDVIHHKPTLPNRIQAIASILEQEKGVLFLQGCISLKNRT
jgi:hypothetical protein